MALSVGNADCTTGLAKRLFDARVATIVLPAPGAMRTACEAALKSDSFAIASAVVAEIAANAMVSVSVGLAGLQTSTASGSPTAAPASPVILAGTIT